MLKEIHGGNIYKYDHKMTDFSANLNPLGMPEAVKKAIIGGADEYESYPDPFCRELKTAISEYHGKDHDLICCGNGAADLIYRIAAAYKPKKALIAAPAFSEYGEALEMTESRIDYCIADENKGFRFGEELIKALSRGYDMQFLKSGDSSELNVLRTLPGVEVVTGKPIKKFSFQMTEEEKQETRDASAAEIKEAERLVNADHYDLVVFDECLGAIEAGLMDEQVIIDFLNNRPDQLEVVLTGRNPSEKLMDIADYVSRIDKVKHPYDKGVPAREGIEY